ncbi:Transcription initiation factor TFIID subunit 11 [Galemys pyrenaicus]|uniref:Transcription initiation factor TFIID subunit 11 n=1 Tax=Galemys pyrenaicus TaxID=202257 RepID=A0A8J6DLC8_GALPY|nr:Transcription initiation factor TFIID subunit 11 [Galemys pyrenaicus]
MLKTPRSPAEENGATGASSDRPTIATPMAPRNNDLEGQLSGKEGSALRTGERGNSPPCPPAAKRLKKDGRQKKDKRPPSVDEDKVDKMKVLVEALSTEQLDRYELYRRSAFPRAVVKRLMQDACGSGVPQNAVIAMAGIAKVFVGEVVEEALDVCEMCGEQRPLQPKHLREAVRRLRAKGQMPNTKYKKTLFF